MRTRHAGTLDRRAVIAIDPVAATDLLRREHIGTAIAARRCLVAERDGRVVGYALLTRNFYGRDFLELLIVAEDARRGGVGSALLTAVERDVQGRVLFTSTNESNAPMRALLLKRGYAPSGRIENLDPGDPELVFVKRGGG
ncbi:MAG TPA: GNAT family N-acetyltransferase [Rhizomicrobium sp.]|jgi:GNAT superfamily N-acetyltransferase